MSVHQDPTDASHVATQDAGNPHPRVADKISPAETEQEHASLDRSVHSEKRSSSLENQNQDESNAHNESDEKTSSGAPLDRVPSQAQKLGKKKIIIIMTALCVRHFFRPLPLSLPQTMLYR